MTEFSHLFYTKNQVQKIFKVSIFSIVFDYTFHKQSLFNLIAYYMYIVH